MTTARIRVRTLDDAPPRRPHIVLVIVVTIDVMIPTALAFIAPGLAYEYGLKST
jgi:putative MFS transporter